MSLERLATHRRIWSRKPTLATIYGQWFDLLLADMPPGARVLEVGAGPGFFAEHARRMRRDLRWISSDLIRTPWNHVVADALRLPVREGTFDFIAGLDVLHHFSRPRDFFREAARALRPAGRIVLVEPWITPVSYPIYRFLHQEDCRLEVDPWAPFGADGSGAKDAFDGDAALVWALVRRTSETNWRALGFLPPRVRPLNCFAYILSLGFKPASLLPRGLAAPLVRLDAATSSRLASRLGARACVVWERDTR